MMMMRSKEYFFPGDEIFSSSPFMFCVVDEMRESHCNGCLEKSSSELISCQKCEYVFYCGRECRKQHWNIHKLECRRLQKIASDYPNHWDRFLALLILKLEDPKAWEIADQVGYVKTTFRDLHYKFDEEDSEDHFTDIFIRLCHYIGEDMIAYEDFRPIYGKVWYNFISIWERGQSRKAIGLYPGLSLFQHSCDADTLQIFDGFNLHLRIRKIVPSRNLSEITVDRLHVIAERRKRQNSLKTIYFADCSCPRCEDDAFENEVTKVLNPEEERDPESIYQRLTETISIIEILEQKNDWEAVYDICKVSAKYVEETLGEKNLYQLSILHKASLSSFCMNKFQETRYYLLKMINIYQFYFGSAHPSVTEIMLKISVVELLLKNKERSRTLFYQTLRLKALTHGFSNPEYRKLSRAGEEFEDQNWADVRTELLLEFWRGSIN